MQCLILIILIVLGFVFVQSGYIETVVFDKRLGRLIVYKTNVFCMRYIKAYRLSEISLVRAVQRGYKTRNQNTLHYKIVIDFES